MQAMLTATWSLTRAGATLRHQTSNHKPTSPHRQTTSSGRQRTKGWACGEHAAKARRLRPGTGSGYRGGPKGNGGIYAAYTADSCQDEEWVGEEEVENADFEEAS